MQRHRLALAEGAAGRVDGIGEGVMPYLDCARLVRFRLATWLIHAGLRVMPASPAKTLLAATLWAYNDHIRKQVADA